MTPPSLLATLHARGVIVGWGRDGLSLRVARPQAGMETSAMPALLAEARRNVQILSRWFEVTAAACGATEVHTGPLSDEQRGLWIAAASPSDDQAQLIELTLRWRPGDGSPPLPETVAALARRHPMLSALFLPGSEEPMLCFPLPAPAPSQALLDLRHLDANTAAEALRHALKSHSLRPFALNREPCLRVLHVFEPGGGIVVQLVRHHLVSDGWSLGLMLRELSGIAAALRAGEPVRTLRRELTYAEYACRQRLTVSEGTEAAAEIDRLRGRRLRTFMANRVEGQPWVLRRTMSALPALTLARHERLTLFAVACGLFALTLGWQLGRRELTFAIDVSTRHRIDLEKCVGTFVNRAMVAMEVPEEGRVTDFLANVAVQLRVVSERGGVPFDRLIQALGVRRGEGEKQTPDVVFGMHAEPRHAPYRALGNAELIALDTVQVHVPLSFYLTVDGDQLHLELRHDTACFAETAARHLADGFEAAMTGLPTLGEDELAVLHRVVVAVSARQARFGSYLRDRHLATGTVRISRRSDADRGPVIYERTSGHIDSTAWLIDQAEVIERDLDQKGAVLLRGFGIQTPEALDRCLRALYGAPMSYQENTSVRTALLGEIKTSTDHPADQWIEQHSEQSYSRILPARLLMCCGRAAAMGGETPIADSRRILARLPQHLVRRLQDNGYLYRAHFRRGLRPDWRETYLLNDRTALERHLDWAGISWRWINSDELVTEIRRPTVITHPRTAEAVWFNHILFWHHSSLESCISRELIEQFGIDGLPHAVFYGDGSNFSVDDIAAIREAHRAETWMTRWRTGDLLLLDNLLRTHGRAPFTGDRRVLFAMAHPLDVGAAWPSREHRSLF